MGDPSSFSNGRRKSPAGGGAYDAANDAGVWSTVPDNVYKQDYGTSMAAPLVAGTASNT